MVLLIIKEPFRRKIRTVGWNSNGVPERAVPMGIESWIHPREVQVAMMAELVKQANGIGVPSKYCDLPVLSFGSIATVTLNLASLVKPHST